MRPLFLLTSLILPLNIFAFSDVTISDPVYDSTTYLQAVEVFSGYEDGSFGRNKTINRAEALKTILLAAEVEIPESAQTERFSDVPEGIWFATFVNHAAEMDIVKGDDTTGLFSPGRNVNKAEFLKMMMLAFEVDPTAYPAITDVELADVPEGIWFEPYFKFAAKYEILTPDNDGMVSPGQELSRGQAAELLFSIMRQGKGLKPQILLSLAEKHLIRSLQFLEQEVSAAPAVLANIAQRYTTYALELLPDNSVVQSAEKAVRATLSLSEAFSLDIQTDAETAISTAQNAWALAEESRSLNPQNKILTDKIKQLAEAKAAQAREQ